VAITESISTYRPMTPTGAVMGRLLASFDGWLFRRRERNELTRTLLKMSDRDLRDLGINRTDFPAIIGGSYRR